MNHDKIAVVDFGGQFCHLIATKIRKLDVLAEIKDPCDPLDSFKEYKGIVLSGSPALASAGEGSQFTEGLLDLELPIIGFCFGHQEIAKHYGGQVEHTAREYGFAKLQIYEQAEIFHGLGPEEQVWMSHGDSVTELGEGFIELASSTIGDGRPPHRNAAIAHPGLKRYGFQYHPEVDDTVHGLEMLSNFVFRICGCRPTWKIDDYVAEQMEAIRREAGERSVFLLASGGVDSTVTARLIEKALGASRLQLLHIDNGLMRKGESRRVVDRFREYGMGENLHFIDASETFLQALAGVTEPERKRQIIGTTFIDVFNSEAQRLDLEGFMLGQGTIYPDTIETGGTKHSDVIKTHHNRVDIVEQMIAEGRVIEPLRELYKSEVRELGKQLEISDDLLYRHPFPGPGLGIRVLCAADGEPEGYDPQGAGAQLKPLLEPSGLEGLLLPVRSVGVKADLRSYEFPVLLHGPGAEWQTLTRLAGRICQEVPGVNRGIYNLLDEAPVSAEVQPGGITLPRLDLLRELDQLVMDGLRRHGLMADIWQCPTVLVPLAINSKGSELAVVRPILSERGMTAAPSPLPDALIDELRQAVKAFPEVSGLAIDVTSKPPSTIEWE